MKALSRRYQGSVKVPETSEGQKDARAPRDRALQLYLLLYLILFALLASLPEAREGPELRELHVTTRSEVVER